MDQALVEKYTVDLSAPYTKINMQCQKSDFKVNHIDTGTMMYSTEHSTYLTSKLKAMISTGKAVGMDPITDKYLKRNRNFKYLANYINNMMNGLITPGPLMNRARMMLLSKENTSAPPIGRIRPI